MCAIVDASAVFEVFGRRQTEAGRQFRDWLDSGRGQLVVGGKVLEELTQTETSIAGSWRRADRVAAYASCPRRPCWNRKLRSTAA